jgi:hypothetical protein
MLLQILYYKDGQYVRPKHVVCIHCYALGNIYFYIHPLVVCWLNSTLLIIVHTTEMPQLKITVLQLRFDLPYRLPHLELKVSIREMLLTIKPIADLTYQKSTYSYTEITSETNGLDLWNLNLWPDNKNYHSWKLKYTHFDIILFTLEYGLTSKP